MRGLRIECEAVLVIGQAVEPLKCTIYFGIAKTRTRQLVAQFTVIGFRFFIGVDVGLKQIHQYVEYIFFHAWSGSLLFPIQYYSAQ